VQWNIKGYYSRLPHLHELIDEQNPSVLCLQETWMKHSNHIRLKNFQFPPARTDRKDNNRGGTCIIVANGIPYTIIQSPEYLEASIVTIHLPDRDITICSLYLPPSLNNATLIENLNRLISLLQSPYIITVDANAHHPVWGSDKAVSTQQWHSHTY